MDTCSHMWNIPISLLLFHEHTMNPVMSKFARQLKHADLCKLSHLLVRLEWCHNAERLFTKACQNWTWCRKFKANWKPSMTFWGLKWTLWCPNWSEMHFAIRNQFFSTANNAASVTDEKCAWVSYMKSCLAFLLKLLCKEYDTHCKISCLSAIMEAQKI